MIFFYTSTSIKCHFTVNKKAKSTSIASISLNIHIKAKIHPANRTKITISTFPTTEILKSKQSSSESWLHKTTYALFPVFLSQITSLILFKIQKKIHSQTQQKFPHPFLQKKL